MTSPTVLVTGATGYVGGRLVPRLLDAGWQVRCLVRDRARLEGRPWYDRVEAVEGDVLRPESLRPALEGATAAFYLVHSMGAGSKFDRLDRDAAAGFAAAAQKAGVGRIIYLGGLAAQGADLSEHLRSRQQTGDALRSAGVPVTEFRAGVIVGSGSLSFEMIRYLTERVPVMICPRWVYTRAQPIAIRDVLDYLVASLNEPRSTGRTVEIGGADVVTYGEMMTTYARVRGLRRLMVPVPVLTPRLSAYWVNIVTPIPGVIARPLIEGVRNENVVRDRAASDLFPEIRPMAYQEAVERALARLEASTLESTWSDAVSSTQGYIAPVTLSTQEGIIVERRRRRVDAAPAAVYRTFTGLGGPRGWLYLNSAWQVRGLLDRLLGGIGMRRGRRHPDELRVGDPLDFWRVEAVEPDRLLRLRAEMKVPGKAWLQFEAIPGDGGTLLVQTAFFAPRGLGGWLYWYALYPVHALIFSGLVRRLGQSARGDSDDMPGGDAGSAAR
jgi:uncharacterized protein YbjT (DUF2867 family)